MIRSVALLTILLLVAIPAGAGVGPGDILMIGGGSYVFGTSAVTGETVEGTGFGISLEQLASSANFSMGVALVATSLSKETTEQNEVIRRTITSVPFYFGAKYWHGDTIFQLFIGGYFGAYFSDLETTNLTTGEPTSTISIEGAGFSVPVGFAVTVTDKFFFTAGYTLNWLWDHDFFENDIVNSVNLGLGINFSG